MESVYSIQYGKPQKKLFFLVAGTLRGVAVFGKQYGSFSPKFCGEFFCQNSFPAILRLKKINKILFPLSSWPGH